MERSDGDSFTALLNGVFETYARQPPGKEAKLIWWESLSEFPYRAVRAAMLHYTTAESKFPPTPAQIREMLGAGKGDGRPGADEAWAIALPSRDEADTVVWTQEIAEAFGACRPVLNMGDEVGARMAFKGAYERIVTAARMQNRPVQWVASVGFDPDRREKVLRQAECAGLLPAPQVAALLPPPESESTREELEIARENTAKLKAMIADALAAKVGASDRSSDSRVAAQKARKAEIAKTVAEYEERLNGI